VSLNIGVPSLAQLAPSGVIRVDVALAGLVSVVHHTGLDRV